jgi:hypothetical protein
MCFQDRSGARHFFGRAIRHHEKSIGLERSLVVDHVVLRNARVKERSAQSADTTYYNRAFDSRYHHGREIPDHDNRPDDRQREKDPAE